MFTFRVYIYIKGLKRMNIKDGLCDHILIKFCFLNVEHKQASDDDYDEDDFNDDGDLPGLLDVFRNDVAAAAASGSEMVPAPPAEEEEGGDGAEAAPEHGPEVVEAAPSTPDAENPLTVIVESPMEAPSEEISAGESQIPASQAEIPAGHEIPATETEISCGHAEIPPGHH